MNANTELRKLAGIIASWTGENIDDVISDYTGRFDIENVLIELRDDAEVFESREAYVLENER